MATLPFVQHARQMIQHNIGPVDLVLLAVKGWQVPQAIETMRPLVGPETFVVPLLNGVEAPGNPPQPLERAASWGASVGSTALVVSLVHIRNVFP